MFFFFISRLIFFFSDYHTSKYLIKMATLLPGKDIRRTPPSSKLSLYNSKYIIYLYLFLYLYLYNLYERNTYLLLYRTYSFHCDSRSTLIVDCKTVSRVSQTRMFQKTRCFINCNTTLRW